MPVASRFSKTASRFDRTASSPVGFFDSGVGGLCVREAFRRRLPHEDTVYIADTANCPYGNRPAAEIVRLARRHVRALLARGCKMVVVTCNTATAAAIDDLRATWPDIPFVGMEPAVKPAVLRSRSGVVYPVSDHALITWLSCIAHVACHAVITWLSCTTHLADHAMIM